MNTNSLNTNLVIGLAAFGLALVAAGVQIYRRKQARGAAGLQEVDDMEAEAGARDEEPAPGEPLPGDQEPHKEMNTYVSQENQPLKYIFLVLVLSIPFYLLGYRKLPLPVNLPASALMFFSTFIAALILVYRQAGIIGLKDLLMRAVDYHKIENKIWYVPSLFLAPLIYFLAYLTMRWVGVPLPNPEFPILTALVLFVLFFLESPLEELGWMGYAIDPMQNRWGALKASIMMGFVWQIWHLIPDIQAHNTAGWIFWHTLEGIGLRILMVWIYNNTGKSVFTSLLVHTVSNVSWALFPNFGSGYDPFYTAVITWLFAGFVILGWGPKTFARYNSQG